MEQLNQPVKGLVTDVNPELVPSNMFVDAKNFRIIDRDGKSYMATTISGTEHEFSLSQGFVPLGAREYQGILFIASYNEITNEGEIGCFPSPVSWSIGNSQYEHTYKPLHNYLSDEYHRDYFRTELFNFDLSHQIEMEIRESYDGSVNIYFTDFKNPLRVVNSGFTIVGNLNEQTYVPDDFRSTINVIETPEMGMETMDVKLSQLWSTGGSLPGGTYFVYVAYVADDGSVTPYIGRSGPIKIMGGYDDAANNDNPNIEGNTDTGRFKIRIFNINDSSYSSLRIVIQRYYSSISNGVTTSDLGIVTPDPTISLESDGSMLMMIDTFSKTTEVTANDLFRQIQTEDVVRSITQLNGKLWGANWRGRDLHNKDLQNLALMFKATPVSEKRWPAHDGVIYIQDSEHTYADPFNVIHYTGYFHEETYPFALYFKFHDGRESQAYPITGHDYLKDSSGSNATWDNNKGYVRFPEISDSFPLMKAYNNVQYIQSLGVKIEPKVLSDVIDFINNSAYIKANVKEIVVVRGERKENLLYQGLSIYGGHTDSTQMWGTPATNDNINIMVYSSEDAFSPYDVLPPYGSYGQHVQHGSDFYYRIAMGNYWRDDSSSTVKGIISDNKWGAAGNYEIGSGEIAQRVSYKGFLPLFKGYAPFEMIKKAETLSERNRNFMERIFPKDGFYGVFSPDFMLEALDESETKEPGYIKTVAHTHYDLGDGSTSFKYIAHIDNATGPVTIPHVAYASIQSYPHYAHSDFTKQPLDGFHRVNKHSDPATVDYPDGNGSWSVKDFVGGTRGVDHITINNGDNPSSISSWDGCFFAGLVDASGTTNDRVFALRNLMTAPYIGVKYSGQGGRLKSSNDSIVNLYNTDPESIIIDNYDYLSESYKEVQTTYSIADNFDDLNNVKTTYNGDCFVQRTAFKNYWWIAGLDKAGASNNRTDINSSDYSKDAKTVFNRFGLVLDIVTENKINSSYRIEYVSNGYTFTPKKAYDDFAIMRFGDGGESFYYNQGYTRMLQSRSIYPFDPNIPYNGEEHSTRIRYSDEYVPGAITDAYKSFQMMSKQDFDTNHGEMMKIINLNGKIYTVLRDAIYEHSVDERRLQKDSSGEDLVLGTGNILYKRAKQIASYGTQHQWSIINDGQSVYGVDYMQGKIWTLVGQVASTGNMYATVIDLLEATNNTTLAMQFRHIYSEEEVTDITQIIDDNPVQGEGILTSVNNLHDEIVFTFKGYKLFRLQDNTLDDIYDPRVGPDGHPTYSFADVTLESIDGFLDGCIREKDRYYYLEQGQGLSEVTISGNTIHFTNVEGYSRLTFEQVDGWWYLRQEVSKTYIYSKRLKNFIGEHTYWPIFYYTLKDNFYSSLGDAVNGVNRVYKHDTGENLTFFNVLCKASMSYIVNGMTAQGNASVFRKLYDTIEIESPKEELYRIEYETEYQQAEHYPFIEEDRMWLFPEYKEDKWNMAIERQNSADDTTGPRAFGFEQEAQMRGLWMKVTVEYRSKIYFFIKNIITKFRISNT